MRDGTSMNSRQMGLGGHPPSDMAYREGPIDPELGVVSFTTESLRPVALLLHYTCNAVHDYPLRCITADWPGAWSSRIRAMYGDDCVALVINGCNANINHDDPLNPTHVDTTERMGATLAEATLPVLKQLDLRRLESRSGQTDPYEPQLGLRDPGLQDRGFRAGRAGWNRLC
jgi:hypothetical protein